MRYDSPMECSLSGQGSLPPRVPRTVGGDRDADEEPGVVPVEVRVAHDVLADLDRSLTVVEVVADHVAGGDQVVRGAGDALSRQGLNEGVVGSVERGSPRSCQQEDEG